MTPRSASIRNIQLVFISRHHVTVVLTPIPCTASLAFICKSFTSSSTTSFHVFFPALSLSGYLNLQNLHPWFNCFDLECTKTQFRRHFTQLQADGWYCCICTPLHGQWWRSAYRRSHSPSQVAWSEGRRSLGAVLHSSNEPNELLQ